ncbi:MAG: hypothetical protein SynsKO_41410 [Synoicihabitans sp.]
MITLSRFSPLLLLSLGGAVVLSAQTPRSPFMPKVETVQEAAPEVVENAEYQFCGVFGDGEDKRFLIFNVSSNRSSWLRLSQEGPDELFVDAYDAEQGTVNIRQGGRALTLGLQAATINGSAPRTVVAAPVPLAGNTTDLETTVRVNPTPADERRRLEAVAAEVRRRRAARAAAATAANPR